MDYITKGLANITANDGASLSLVGMGIVFFSLLFIALIIYALPHLLKILDKIIPEKVVEPNVRVKSKNDNGAVIAVITAAIAQKNKKLG